MQYEAHEYSLVFPDMEADQFAQLVHDIKARGLLHEIVLFEGKILDGRHRYRACLEANVTPRFRTFKGDDPSGYVVSENLSRRHLSASQLGMVAASLAEVECERARRRSLLNLKQGDVSPMEPIGSVGEKTGRTAVLVARKLNIGQTTAQRGMTVRKKGIPDVVKAVENGVVKISEAEKIVKLSPAAQQRIISIADKRERSAALATTLRISRAARNRSTPKADGEALLPGTKFLRQFLGSLENMVNRLSQEFDLKTSDAIVDQFNADMRWDSEQLRKQIELITPLMESIAEIRNASRKIRSVA